MAEQLDFFSVDVTSNLFINFKITRLSERDNLKRMFLHVKAEHKRTASRKLNV